MPNTPEEEALILQLTQLISACHGAAKPQNTVQAENSAAKLWKVSAAWPLLLFLWRPSGFQGQVTHTHVVLQRYCEQEAHRFPDGDLMSQAKILEFSMWLVDEAVQQNDARYSFSMQSVAFQLELLFTGHLWTGFSCELQVWKLSEFQTVPEAFEAFSNISVVPLDLRRWHGSKKEARASSMAFSRFKNGLAAEVRNRMAALGSIMAAVVKALEMERERITATRTISSLQQLCSRYSSDFKLLGKHKQSG